MKIENSVVFVTGANRGLGREFARQALALGAKKVYAAARDTSKVDLRGVTPIRLDVTDRAAVADAVGVCTDVSILINNAGIGRVGGVTGADAESVLREQMETNVFGMLYLSQAFAPTLARNGGGAILNLLSVLSWVNSPVIGAYGVTKAAAWALTNSLRTELRTQGTQVCGFHGGFIDTDMIRSFDVPKAAPADVVGLALAALEGGQEEVLVDAVSRQIKDALSQGVYLRDPLNG